MRNLMLFLTLATSAFAGGFTVSVPEIDATSATAALTLLSGGILVLRSRRVQK
jgi:hypothetical protein